MPIEAQVKCARGITQIRMLGEVIAGSESSWARALLQTPSLSDELESLVIFDADAAVLLGTMSIAEDEAAEMMSLFHSRDEAMTNGIDFLGDHFDVHR